MDEISFVGGPLDGLVRPVVTEDPPHGGNAVIDVGNNRCAWYQRDGDKYRYHGSMSWDQVQALPKPA